jgi:HSP20 family protein
VSSFRFPLREIQVWQPAVDVYRTADGWILKFDLAGVKLEDVQVNVGSRTVTVSGVRRDWLLEEAGCCHYSMEINYSRFERTIELPGYLDRAKFRLDYRDGILFVRISVNDKEEGK